MRETPKIMAHTSVLGKNRSLVSPPYGNWSYVEGGSLLVERIRDATSYQIVI